MPRKLKSYAFQHNVIGQPVTVGTSPIAVWYWVATNLNDEVYGCPRLRNILGIWPEQFARDMTNGPSIIIVNNSQELCRMGVCAEITCTVKAVDYSDIYEPFGVEHTTSFLFDLNKSLKEVANNLLAGTFEFGPNPSKYQVVAGTIKQKKRKATTARLG